MENELLRDLLHTVCPGGIYFIRGLPAVPGGPVYV